MDIFSKSKFLISKKQKNTGTTAYDCSRIGVIGLTIELPRFGGRKNQTKC